MERLINVKNKWGDKIAASKVVGEAFKVDVEEVWQAMKNMNYGKANEPFGVILAW